MKTKPKNRDKSPPDEPSIDLGCARFVTAQQLRQRYGGRSPSWLERLIAKPDFPKPITPMRYRLWSIAEVEAWERAQAVAAK
jgi:hypothetical protein